MRFLATLSLVAAAATGLSHSAVKVNGIAAKANGELITMNELMIKLAPMQSILMAQSPRRGSAYEKTLSEMRDKLLDELIDRTIIYSEYKDRLQAIPEHVVDEEIEKIIQRVYAGDRKLFRDYLKATNLSYAQFKEQQRKEILVSVIKSQQFGDPPPATDAELRKEYRDWAIANRDRKKDVATYRKIYISKMDPYDISVTPESQLSLAESIVRKIKGGADFATLAKEYSKDSKSDEGGLWENVPRTDLNMEFGHLVFETVGNEVMGPFEDQRGFTIFKVIDRKFGSAKPFASVKKQMQTRVNNKKKNAKFEVWMKKLRDRVPIKKMIK
ncbi:peptidylprolyl isomerase [Akkermansiaceae bacterium]|nr:peptidylprolyl isomerase [Akkermansiaceae bacterium]MDB4287076.1 peptidylprolyl isomerase [Akkermansiaceae bacterium]MDB4305173.1 peptidylprolyl isomerase [Akkermansiaceae bacterium]MDB4309440.1 peptidylprolyl isomerase [Akkermansiaceae bacterium]MDB4597037.1 peptidylprolyl isomerase [Akkermansiaceae bacterium]